MTGTYLKFSCGTSIPMYHVPNSKFELTPYGVLLLQSPNVLKNTNKSFICTMLCAPNFPEVCTYFKILFLVGEILQYRGHRALNLYFNLQASSDTLKSSQPQDGRWNQNEYPRVPALFLHSSLVKSEPINRYRMKISEFVK
ncbi:hypothetical protein QTP88_012755 [Uroleucon formosanum]